MLTRIALCLVAVALASGLSYIVIVSASSAGIAADLSGWNVINQNYGDMISMVSANDGWIAEISGSSINLYHWDGSNWTNTQTINHDDYVVRGDLAMVSDHDGWLAFGEPLDDPCADTQSRIYRWNGSTWSYYNSFSDPYATSMASIDMLTENDGWLASAGCFYTNFYRWNGSSWYYLNHTVYPLWVDNDIDFLSGSDGWAVGFTGKIARWDGSSWSEVSSPVNTSLNSIAMLSGLDGWIVGDEGVILRWNGSAWTQVTSPVTSTLKSISMVSATDGWAVGAGTSGQISDPGVILHWDGYSWSKATSPSTAELNEVTMMTATDGWIAGYGATLRYEPTHLTINYTAGQPGSFFNLTGYHFPANSPVNIQVNGHPLNATVVTNNTGVFTFTLSTSQADPGQYSVVASVNPSASTSFTLNAAEPLRLQEGNWTILDIPAGIAFDQFIYLPLSQR